jgi:hypothetical protein
MPIKQINGPTFREVFGDVPEYVGGRPTPEFHEYCNGMIKAMDAPSHGGQAFDAITGRDESENAAAHNGRGFWKFNPMALFESSMNAARKPKAQAFDSADPRAARYAKIQSAYDAMADLSRWGKGAFDSSPQSSSESAEHAKLQAFYDRQGHAVNR